MLVLVQAALRGAYEKAAPSDPNLHYVNASEASIAPSLRPRCNARRSLGTSA